MMATPLRVANDLLAAAELVPSLAEVRELATHSDPRLARGAAEMLALVHLPEDAVRVLQVFERHGATRGVWPDWLAALPGSIELFELALGTEDLFELVRRRRCAGLPNPAHALRPRVLEAIAEGDGMGARIVAELRDASYIDALMDGLTPYDAGLFRRTDGWRAITSALEALGEPALIALRRRAAMERPTSRIASTLDTLEEQASGGGVTVGYADKLFVEGRLEDAVTAADTAFARYASHFAACPSDPYAAFQLAWIDRAFGSPITDLRIDWLGGLGVSSQLLEMLAERPRAFVIGIRSMVARGDDRRCDPELAARAEAAGVPGVAATYVADARERERLRAAAAAHLHRVRAACRA